MTLHLHLVVFLGLEILVVIVVIVVYVSGLLCLGRSFGVVDSLSAGATAGDDVAGVDGFQVGFVIFFLGLSCFEVLASTSGCEKRQIEREREQI